MNLSDHLDTVFQIAWWGRPGMSNSRIDEDWSFRYWSLCLAVHRGLLSDALDREIEPYRLGLILEDAISWEFVARVISAQLMALRQPSGQSALVRYSFSAALRSVTTRERLLARYHELGNSETLLGGVEQLRRKCMRWTDLMISPLAEVPASLQFAHCPERCRQFGDDKTFGRASWDLSPMRGIQAAAIHRSVPQRLLENAQRFPLYREVLGHCLDLLPAEAFQSNGTLKSRRQWQLDSQLLGGTSIAGRKPNDLLIPGSAPVQ